MKSLKLIRHFKPEGAGVFMGQNDPDLDAAPVSIPHIKVDVAITSPLKRAKQSAALIFGDANFSVNEAFAEICYGQWDGKSWQEIERQWPEIAAAKMDNWLGITPPGGESWDDFSSRVLNAFKEIESTDASIAILAHAGVNSVINHYLTGEDPLAFTQEYGEVIEY